MSKPENVMVSTGSKSTTKEQSSRPEKNQAKELKNSKP
jgi:hypothetical protein